MTYRRITRLDCTSTTNYFKLKGRLFHWSLLFIPMIWGHVSLVLLDKGQFINFLILSLLALSIGIIQVLSLWYEIEIDKNNVRIKLILGFIPFRTITSATKDLIIDHRDAEHLTLISQRKDYYSEDVKNNLRFEYIAPWGEDKDNFYVQYKDKEVEFVVGSDEEVWTKIIEGLTRLEKA